MEPLVMVGPQTAVSSETENRIHRHWLVDMENVPHRWNSIIDSCVAGDIVTLFVSKQVGPIRLDILARAEMRGISFRFIECETGIQNAMDFQLVTELGRLSVTNPTAEFVIVSGDHGFRSVVKYMADRNVRVSCVVPENADKLEAAKASGEHVDPVKESYRSKLSDIGLDGDELTVVTGILYDAMFEPPNMRKLTCLNRLRSEYGNMDGRYRYQIIKSVVHDVAINGPLPSKSKEIERIQLDVSFTNEVNRLLAKAGVPLKQGYAPKIAKAVLRAREAKDGPQSLKSGIDNLYTDVNIRVKAYDAVKSLL